MIWEFFQAQRTSFKDSNSKECILATSIKIQRKGSIHWLGAYEHHHDDVDMLEEEYYIFVFSRK